MSALLDRTAVRDIVPAMVGTIPFGLSIGVTIAGHPVGPALGLGSAAGFFAGTAHLSALTMIAAGAGPPAVLAAVVAVNSRLLLYGAALAPRFADQPSWFRWFGPLALVDQTFAVAADLPADVGGARFRRYWLTAGLVMAAGFLLAHVVGMVAAPALPPWLPLDIAAPAVLVGLLVPHLRGRGIRAAVVAAAVTVAGAALPAGVGPLVGAVAGLASVLVARRPAGTLS